MRVAEAGRLAEEMTELADLGCNMSVKSADFIAEETVFF